MSTQVQLPSPYAEVELQPLQLTNGDSSSRRAVVLDPSSLALEVGVVSSDYKLVPNREVVHVAERLLSKTGNKHEVIDTKFNGKRFMQRYRLAKVEGEVRVGDVVGVTLDAINSYDGSTTFGLEFNAVRLVCSNGMMLSLLLGGFRFKHWGDQSFEEELNRAERKLSSVGNRLHQVLPMLSDMTQRRMRRKDVQRFFRDTSLPITTQAKIFDAITEDNAWGIYNAATDVLTRQESFAADKLNKRVSQWFLSKN